MVLELVVSVLLVLVVVTSGIALTWLQRRRRRAEAEAEAWQDFADVLLTGQREFERDVPGNPDFWPTWFCELVWRQFRAAGVLLCRADAPARADGHLEVLGRSGVCLTWNLPEGPDGRLRWELPGSLPSDFFWSRRPQFEVDQRLGDWLPERLRGELSQALVAPLRTAHGDAFVLVLGPGDERQLVPADLQRLELTLRATERSLQTVDLEAKLTELRRDYEQAHERGMLQVSTGIIHNIGNAIAAIQLALSRLRGGELKSGLEVLKLIREEMLPALRDRLDVGDLEGFLRDDAQGKEFLPSLDHLAAELERLIRQQLEDVVFVEERFDNVSEIIALQQQFIGELGTENVVTLAGVVEDVAKFCRAPLEQRGIAFEVRVRSQGRVLVDRSMLRHLLTMLVKYSVESVTAGRKADPLIGLTVTATTEEGQRWLKVTLTDNGTGLQANLDVPTDTPRSPSEERARDLHFCRRRIEKYGGRLVLASDIICGTRLAIMLPEYQPAEEGRESTDSDPAGEPDEPDTATESPDHPDPSPAESAPRSPPGP